MTSDEEWHGSYAGYRGKCRCDDCREWKRSDNKSSRDRALDNGLTHGTNSAYRYGCRCEDCCLAKSAENKSINMLRTADDHYSSHLKRRYGLTKREYQALWDSQKGMCAICKDTPAKRLVVDHCHESGRVRELLCGHCNSALGFARDDPGVLRRMADYLERHKPLIN